MTTKQYLFDRRSHRLELPPMTVDLLRAAIPKEDAVTFDEPRQSLVYLLASRVCQQQAIRDGSGNVGFRCADGRVATIPRADFEPQLRDALTRALTESRYWGE